MAKAKRDIEETITNRIVASLEEGVAPWVKPWKGGETQPTNPISGTRYRGINVILLGMAGLAGGFDSNRWVTFKQVQSVAMDAMARDLGKEVMASAPNPEGKRGKNILAGWMRKQLEEMGKDTDQYPHVRQGEKARKSFSRRSSTTTGRMRPAMSFTTTMASRNRKPCSFAGDTLCSTWIRLTMCRIT